MPPRHPPHQGSARRSRQPCVRPLLRPPQLPRPPEQVLRSGGRHPTLAGPYARLRAILPSSDSPSISTVVEREDGKIPCRRHVIVRVGHRCRRRDPGTGRSTGGSRSGSPHVCVGAGSLVGRRSRSTATDPRSRTTRHTARAARRNRPDLGLAVCGSCTNDTPAQALPSTRRMLKNAAPERRTRVYEPDVASSTRAS